MTAIEQAIAFHKQGRLQLAEEKYVEVLSADFDNVKCLYLLGTIYLQTHRIGIAANLFKQALLIEKDYFEAWNNLGNCYKMVNKDEDAKMCWNKALEIKDMHPNDYADIHNNIATLYINSGNPVEGMQYVEKALELCPDHVDANWNKALLLLEQGKYGEGFDRYEWGVKTGHRVLRTYGKEIPIWDGSPGKKVIVWGEQGIGDEILFASMFPDMQKICRAVIFDCHPRLVKIFKESFPDINVYGTRKDAYINWPVDHPDIDARISIAELGKYFRRELKDFPQHNGYLKASQDRITHYRQKLAKLGDRPKIGISWTGGYVKTRKDWRSIPLEKWEPILKKDADFISLQYTPEAYNSIAEVEEKFNVKIHHWPSAVTEGIREEYHETAALVSALDLIITVNTAIHHLAGALGKRVWTLTPKGKAWRYYSPDGKSFPWYPSARCIEQPEIMEWDSVMNQVADKLIAKELAYAD